MSESERMSRTEASAYRPWDRDEKLGPVPEGGFKPDDPKVIAWEAAHGHDLRLKCLPEFGCVLVEERADRIEAIARRLLRSVDSSVATSDLPPTHTLKMQAEELREVLGDA